MADFNTGSVRANGINFHYLEMGDGPLAICLHGFPDHAWSFRHLLPDLAAAGFHAVAPFMRGYAPTEAPADGRYHSALMARDAVELIGALGADRAYLIGNDWGAGAVVGATALAPEKVIKLVTIASGRVDRELSLDFPVPAGDLARVLLPTPRRGGGGGPQRLRLRGGVVALGLAGMGHPRRVSGEHPVDLPQARRRPRPPLGTIAPATTPHRWTTRCGPTKPSYLPAPSAFPR